MTSNGAILSCIHTVDNTVKVDLVPVPMYLAGGQQNIPPNASYTALPNNQVYKTEITRFNNEIAIADAKIDKETKIATAFTALQEAENARDVAPDAYEQARITYYTLVKGDTWLQEEKERIANTEAQPMIDGFVSQYNILNEKRQQQQSTIDLMNGFKDKVLTVKDDLEFSVKNFGKQINDIKNQINKDKRDQTEIIAQTSSWIDVFLNWLIAIVTIIAIFFLARRFLRSKPQTLEEIETQARMMRAQAGLLRATRA